MTEPDDDKVVQRYRSLGREEPPAGLDAKILAASRRAVRARPSVRRWALPLSLAAVIVLSVTVTLEMQREHAALEEQPNQAPPARPAPEPKLQKPAPSAAPAAPAASFAGRPSRESADRQRFERAAPAAAEERAKQLGAEESPERWLERIAALRRAGRDEEADRLLAEFRRRYPGYRISEAMRKKVER